MISLTKTAAKNFKRIREDEELPEDVPLRVSVKGGGCAGYEYVLEFGKPTNRDLFFCLLYTSPSPRDQRGSRMPSSA